MGDVACATLTSYENYKVHFSSFPQKGEQLAQLFLRYSYHILALALEYAKFATYF